MRIKTINLMLAAAIATDWMMMLSRIQMTMMMMTRVVMRTIMAMKIWRIRKMARTRTIWLTP